MINIFLVQWRRVLTLVFSIFPSTVMTTMTPVASIFQQLYCKLFWAWYILKIYLVCHISWSYWPNWSNRNQCLIQWSGHCPLRIASLHQIKRQTHLVPVPLAIENLDTLHSGIQHHKSGVSDSTFHIFTRWIYKLSKCFLFLLFYLNWS